MPSHINHIALSIMLASLIVGCDLVGYMQEEEVDEDNPPVAKVYDEYLYLKDLDGLVQLGASPEDSTNITMRYIDSWIRKQLMINKATNILSFQEADIERKILDYRYALIIYQYEKFYIDRELDKNVSEEEILTYFEEKKDNFLLKQNIVKCLYAKIPQEAPRIDQFRRQIRSYPNDEMEAIKSYAFQFAVKSSLEDTLWVNFDEIIQSTPLASIPNKVQFLKTNSFVETTDDKHVFFLKILDYKISDQVSPLEFIRDDIKNIIINKRKVALKEKLQETVYKEATKNKIFEIYEPTAIKD